MRQILTFVSIFDIPHFFDKYIKAGICCSCIKRVDVNHYCKDNDSEASVLSNISKIFEKANIILFR